MQLNLKLVIFLKEKKKKRGFGIVEKVIRYLLFIRVLFINARSNRLSFVQLYDFYSTFHVDYILLLLCC